MVARMLGRLATGLVAILTFSRRTGSLTGPTKVLDDDTIDVAGQQVRLDGIDAPELDQTFQWRGQQIVCGTMSLAGPEALIAGVKVRCEVVERDRHGRGHLSPTSCQDATSVGQARNAAPAFGKRLSRLPESGTPAA